MNDFVRIAAPAGVGALIGSLIAPVFGLYTNERQAELKKFELSVGVLKDPAKQDNDPLRLWALGVMEKKSKVKFTPEQREVLLKVPPARPAPDAPRQ